MDTCDRNELDWLAFRYIAAELSRDEHAAFEARLADDQAARDAVVRAVDLAEAITLVECAPVSPAHRQPPRNRRRWAAPIAVVAAGVALVLGLSLLRPEPAPHIELAANVTEAGRLIDFWAESTGVLPETTVVLSEAVAANEGVDLAALDDSAGTWEDDQESLAVPDWMFAAVSAQLQDGDEPLEN